MSNEHMNTSEESAEKNLQCEQYVFNTYEEALQKKPAEKDPAKPRWRLYTIVHHLDAGKVCYVYERVATMAVGRAYIHFGADYTVADEVQKITADKLLQAFAGFDDETKKALLKQLQKKQA